MNNELIIKKLEELKDDICQFTQDIHVQLFNQIQPIYENIDVDLDESNLIESIDEIIQLIK